MHYEMLFLFFTIALVYSSAGFGGGSSYLAILALYGIDYRLLRATALLCNIVVVMGGVYIFYRNGHLQWKKVFPLVLASIPMAYCGGYILLEEELFFIILGIVLLFAAILLWFQPIHKKHKTNTASSKISNAGIGGSVGLLSGMVGIGGGIFLSPILHLTRWENAKPIAATAAFFILVNSLAGLAGQFSRPGFIFDWQFALPLTGAVFIGGQIGARLGAAVFAPKWVKRITAILIVIVAVRLLTS